MLNSLKSLKSSLEETFELQKKVFHDLAETIGDLDLKIASNVDEPEYYLLSAATCYYEAKNLEMIRKIIEMMPESASASSLKIVIKYSRILSNELGYTYEDFNKPCLKKKKKKVKKKKVK